MTSRDQASHSSRDGPRNRGTKKTKMEAEDTVEDRDDRMESSPSPEEEEDTDYVGASSSGRAPLASTSSMPTPLKSPPVHEFADKIVRAF